MPRIVLTTLNARYAHAAFGLRYLMANLGPLRRDACILEFDITQRPLDVLEAILAAGPEIVGIGVYVWNVGQATQLVADLKRVRPDIVVVLGGPEVSYETDQQAIVHDADYVITGEADLAFARLCDDLLARRRPLMKVIAAELPQFAGGRLTPSPGTPGEGRGEGSVPSTHPDNRDDDRANPHPDPLPEHRERGNSGEFAAQPDSPKSDVQKGAAAPLAPSSPAEAAAAGPDHGHIRLPYDLYDERDIAGRVIYVEASRGCPFKCEFCLSSLDVPVRNVPLDEFLAAMQSLLDRGVRQFKFVDRTFNLNLNTSRGILEFFLERYQPGLFLHFEMIPDRLPQPLREIIARFPAGALQFEVGVQTFNDDVARRISRRQDNDKLADNLTFLRRQTGVHVHADLIAGLPGEDLASFARGFDRLYALGPQEIQVGILKRLRGTPIVRHDAEWGMVYAPHAPYEVLATKLMDFATLQRIRRFARYWDSIANSGNFIETLPLLVGQASGGAAPPSALGSASAQVSASASASAPVSAMPSAFEQFLILSDWLFDRLGRNHAVALVELAALLFEWLTGRGHAPGEVAAAMWRDYQRTGRSDRPAFLRPYIPETPPRRGQSAQTTSLPKRQSRHLAAPRESQISNLKSEI
jgi:radical SAM superfamily enzyme YgiQ (UPF0313 family)